MPEQREGIDARTETGCVQAERDDAPIQFAPLKHSIGKPDGKSRGAIVALASDPHAIEKSGQLIFTGDAAREYGFTDIDGRYIENFYRATGRV